MRGAVRLRTRAESRPARLRGRGRRRGSRRSRREGRAVASGDGRRGVATTDATRFVYASQCTSRCDRRGGPWPHRSGQRYRAATALLLRPGAQESSSAAAHRPRGEARSQGSWPSRALPNASAPPPPPPPNSGIDRDGALDRGGCGRSRAAAHDPTPDLRRRRSREISENAPERIEARPSVTGSHEPALGHVLGVPNIANPRARALCVSVPPRAVRKGRRDAKSSSLIVGRASAPSGRPVRYP